MTLGDIKQCIT